MSLQADHTMSDSLAPRAAEVWRITLFLALIATASCATIALAEVEEEAPAIWSLHVGGGADEEALGFGWSRNEHLAGRRFRWIVRMEGDVWWETNEVRDTTLHLLAAIPHLDWRRQRIGLFVNGRYVTEWQAPDDHHFHAYRADIPAALLVEGRNRITLRMAYNTRIGRDSRLLALAVDTIELRAR